MNIDPVSSELGLFRNVLVGERAKPSSKSKFENFSPFSMAPLLKRHTCTMLRDEEEVCPITLQSFVHPVVAEDGHVYERSAIEAWFAHAQSKHRITTSPLTGFPMGQRLVVCPLLHKALGLPLPTHSKQSDTIKDMQPSIFTSYEDLLVELNLDSTEDGRLDLNAELLYIAFTNTPRPMSVPFQRDRIDPRTLATALSIAIFRNHRTVFQHLFFHCDERISETPLMGGLLKDAAKCGNVFAFDLLTAGCTFDDKVIVMLYAIAAKHGQQDILAALAVLCEKQKGDAAKDFLGTCCYDVALVAVDLYHINMLDCLLINEHCGQRGDWSKILDNMARFGPFIGANAVARRRTMLKDIMAKYSTSALFYLPFHMFLATLLM